ncbi:MAG: citrate synthase, partial [Myxococcales bacterium]|nr:citrate synthase [Myxococcales bacterium]
FALVWLASACGLGDGAGGYLFALSRVAGWTAHIIEQRQNPDMLRPRARFVG